MSGYERMIYEAVVIEGRNTETVVARFGLSSPRIVTLTLNKLRRKGYEVPDRRRSFRDPASMN